MDGDAEVVPGDVEAIERISDGFDSANVLMMRETNLTGKRAGTLCLLRSAPQLGIRRRGDSLLWIHGKTHSES